MLRNPIVRAAAAAAIVSACGTAQAIEIIVPTQMSLSAALTVAQNGDTITLLPSGSPYVTTTGWSLTGKRLIIRGSTGNPAQVVLDGGGVATVLTISGAAVDGTSIQHLTVRNGRGPTVSNGSGAGIYVHDSDPWVEIYNCIIRDNLVPAIDGNGAGITALNASISVLNTRFENNSVGSAGSTGDGGAFYLNHGSAYILNCVFHNNIAGMAPGGLGGAAWLDDCWVRFSGCTFTGNTAANGGGIMMDNDAEIIIESCRFSQNQSGVNGGAMYANSGALLSVRNSLFNANAAPTGHGAVLHGSVIDATNCTIVGNTGLSTISTPSVTPALSFLNTIISDTGQARASIHAVYCLFQGAMGPVQASSFGNLTAANAMFVNAGAGDFRLQATSPAIDRGDSTQHVGLPVDLDGKPRAVDFPGVANTGYTPFGPIIDIGAYEAQPPAPCYANCDSSTLAPILNVNDFTCFLSRYAAGCP